MSEGPTLPAGPRFRARLRPAREAHAAALHLDAVVRAEVERRQISMETYAALFNGRSEIYAKTLIFLMVPLFAVAVALLNWRASRPFVGHLVFATQYYAFELAFVSGLFLLAYSRILGLIVRALRAVGIERGGASGATQILRHFIIEFPTIVLILPYLYLATRRAYGLAWTLSLLKSLVLVASLTLVTIAYRLILFRVTYLTV